MLNTTDSRYKKRLRKTKAQLIEELEALEQAVAEREQSQWQPNVKYQEDRREIDTLHIQASALAKIGYWVFDHLNPEKHYWSEGMVDIFGVMPNKTGEFFLTATNNEMIHVEDLARVLKTFKSFKTSGEYFDIQYRIIRNDGEIRWLREIGQGVEWRGQHCLRSVGTVQDITQQKQTEIVQIEAAERFRLTIKSISSGAWDWNMVTGHMIPSDSWTEVLGYEPGEIEPHADFLKTLIHPDDKEGVLASLDKLFNGDKVSYSYEYRLRHKSGEYRWFRDQGKVIEFDESGKPVRMVGTDTDTTEQHEIKEALKENRAQFYSILDNSPLVMIVKDAEGRYLLANKEFERVFKVSNDEIIGKLPRDIVGDDLVESAEWQDREVISSKKVKTLEETFFVDGKSTTMLTSKFPILDEKQNLTGVGAVSIDITELKKTEAALIKSEEARRQSEANLRAVVEQAGDAFFLINTKTAKFIEVNNQACSILGYSYDELLTLSVPRVDQSFQLEKFTGFIDSLVMGDPVTIETILLRKDGTIFPVEIRTGLVETQEGTFLLALVRDITERRQAEADLKKFQENLIRNERLVTLGQLTATVSHELRNPLGAMRPALYLLQKYLPAEDERLVVAFERLDRNIDRCDQIIDQMLDFTRIQAINYRFLDLDAWLAEELDEMEAPEGVRVEREFGLDNKKLNFDPERLRRALINVYDNACQAMLEQIDKIPGPGMQLLIETQASDHRIEIIVSDTGPGISEDVLSRIFEPLFSTRSFGVGLGLPTVKMAMQQHGGDVEVFATEGHGTRMVLWLPLPGKSEVAA